MQCSRVKVGLVLITVVPGGPGGGYFSKVAGLNEGLAHRKTKIKQASRNQRQTRRSRQQPGGYWSGSRVAGGMAGWVKGDNCMVTDGNYTFGGKQDIAATQTLNHSVAHLKLT